MKKLSLVLMPLLFFIKLAAQDYPGKIGVGLSGIGGFTMEFVDASKTMRSFNSSSLDANGYPQSDFAAIVFDMRPCCPWVGSVDDPYNFVPGLMSGTYKLSFKGKANVTSSGDPVELLNKVYDENINLTTLDMVVQRDKWLVNLTFSNTQLTASSAVNTGITDIQLLRPGYHNRPKDVFRQELLNALSHFPVIRFMDFVKTNNTNPDFPGLTEWNTRNLPSNALFKDVAPWEYVIKLANLTGKDVWINIPVAASDDYITKLAKIFKDSLTNPDCKIYIEYSNEVWNKGFKQYTYNRNAAVYEVKNGLPGGGASKLNAEAGQCDRNDTSLWCGRRYVKRLKEIGDIFVETFSPGSRTAFSTKIRPVFAWQIGGWVPYYSCILKWFEFVYGEGSAKNNFYGLAGAAYVNAKGAATNATVPAILSKMTSNSDAGRGNKRTTPDDWLSGSGKKGLKQIADFFGIKLLQYETGPDNGGGDPVNIANRIAANRDPEMKTLLIHDLKDNWFADPDIAGDLAMYFVLCSSFTRYGSWGATEEIENMHTPKLQALYSLAGIAEDSQGPSQPGNVQKAMNGNDAVVTWEAATDNVGVTHYRVSDNTGALVTVLANEPLQVTLKNYNSAILYSIKVVAVDAFNNISGFKLGDDPVSNNYQHTLVYPNPVNDNILKIIPEEKMTGGTVSLYNPEGRMIHVDKAASSLIQIDMTGYPVGMYFLKVEKGNQHDIYKVIKQ